MARGWLVVIALWAAPAGAQTARTMVPVWADGRDWWTLLDVRLVNRGLVDQLHAPQQGFRLCHQCLPAVVAADGAIGAQVVTAGVEQSRFHGFFVLDAFAGARPLSSIDVGLNLTILNPSASDGYRVSKQILPGFALHLQPELARLRGLPVVAHLVATDLDLVTLGHGLLLEQVPLEGHMAGVVWNGFELRETFGGRVFWDEDDLFSVSLGAFDRAVEARFTAWLFEDPEGQAPRRSVSYLGLAGQLLPHPSVRLAAEYTARLDGAELRHAALLRADYLDFALWILELHAGYQARWYQRGFGPRDDLVRPTTVPSLPFRTEVYVTNSFEAFGVTALFDQVWQTAMVELRAPATSYLRLFVNAEYWVRWLRDPRDSGLRVRLPRGGTAPGWLHDVFYGVGVELRPWPRAPHRARALLTNKQVAVGDSVLDPDALRFVTDPLVLFTAEYFL